MKRAAAALLIVFALGAFGQQGAEFKPFTAEMRTVHEQGPHGTPLNLAAFYARRSDGSFVLQQELAAPERGTIVNILDKRARRSITIYPSLRASLTFYYSDEAMKAEEWRGVDGCVAMGRLGDLREGAQRVTTRLIGRDARRVVAEDPKDGQRREWWVLEELDCFPLQKSIIGGRGSPQQTTVNWLIEGEPADALFAAPPEYVEMSPLELEAAYAAKYDGAALFGKMVELMQQRYEASKRRRP